MRIHAVTSLVVLLALSGLSALSDPITLTPGAGWSEQYEVFGASRENFASSYLVTQPGTIRLSGYYENTDQYVVLYLGVPVYQTPAVTGPAVDYGDTYGTYLHASDASYSSGLFSTGEFYSPAGELTIEDIGPLYSDPEADGYDGQVGIEELLTPEPGMLAGVGLALLGFAALARRRLARVS